MDWKHLVGSIGGIFGFVLGYSILQIPSSLYRRYIRIQRYVKSDRKSPTQIDLQTETNSTLSIPSSPILVSINEKIIPYLPKDFDDESIDELHRSQVIHRSVKKRLKRNDTVPLISPVSYTHLTLPTKA